MTEFIQIGPGANIGSNTWSTSNSIDIDRYDWRYLRRRSHIHDSLRGFPPIRLNENCTRFAIQCIMMSDVTYIDTFLVPLKSDGPDLNVLSTLIEKHKFKSNGNKLFWGVYYTIPTFHNPTGILFSEGNPGIFVCTILSHN